MPSKSRKTTKYCYNCHEEYHISEVTQRIKREPLPGCQRIVYYCEECLAKSEVPE